MTDDEQALLVSLEARINRLETALQTYADRQNWEVVQDFRVRGGEKMDVLKLDKDVGAYRIAEVALRKDNTVLSLYKEIIRFKKLNEELEKHNLVLENALALTLEKNWENSGE